MGGAQAPPAPPPLVTLLGTNIFYPHFREGRPKKRFFSWPFTFFGGTKLARRRGGARSLPGGAESNSADLASCTQIQG